MRNISIVAACIAVAISISALILANNANNSNPTVIGAEGDSNYTNLVASGDITSGDDMIVGDDLVVTGDIVAKTKSSDITASTTLSANQAGTNFFLNAAAGVNITLPPVATAAGTSYRFTVKAAFATSNFTITSREGDNLEGALIVAGAVVDCDAGDVLTFVNDGENLGDYVEVISDGTKWFVGDSGALTASKLTCSG